MKLDKNGRRQLAKNKALNKIRKIMRTESYDIYCGDSKRDQQATEIEVVIDSLEKELGKIRKRISH